MRCIASAPTLRSASASSKRRCLRSRSTGWVICASPAARRATAAEIAAAAGAEPTAATDAAESAARAEAPSAAPDHGAAAAPDLPGTHAHHADQEQRDQPGTTGDQQARRQPPADAADRTTGQQCAELAAEDGGQHGADDRNADEQEDRQILPVEAGRTAAARAALRFTRRRLGEALAGDALLDLVDRRVQPTGEIAVAECRQHLLAD